MGAEPTHSCTQVGHLVDLPKNKVNSQQNLSWYEVWKAKCVEDTSKQAVRRFHRQMEKVPRHGTGNRDFLGDSIEGDLGQ